MLNTTERPGVGDAPAPLGLSAAAAAEVGRAAVRVECHQCGFEPDATRPAPAACPKCHGGAWERYFPPGSLVSHKRELGGGR